MHFFSLLKMPALPSAAQYTNGPQHGHSMTSHCCSRRSHTGHCRPHNPVIQAYVKTLFHAKTLLRRDTQISNKPLK